MSSDNFLDKKSLKKLDKKLDSVINRIGIDRKLRMRYLINPHFIRLRN